MIKEKRIKDLFIIKAGGDLDKLKIVNNESQKNKYPIYANSAKDGDIYGFCEKAQYPNYTQVW